MKGPQSDYADILTVEVQNGEPRVVLGDALSGDGTGAGVALWGLAGFYSIPDAPTDAGCAQALFMLDGQTTRAYATRDNRLSSKFGTAEPGDRAVFGSVGGTNRMIWKTSDDSVTMYAETPGGDSIVFTLSGGDERMFAAIGSSYIEMKADEGTITMGGVTIHCKDGACTIFGTSFHAACSTGYLGLVGAVAPLPPALGITYGPVGATAVGSTKWGVAP